MNMDAKNGTLCIGIDITWWGGSKNTRVSQRDTIVSGIISPDGKVKGFDIIPVVLSGLPNHDSGDMSQANFDAQGELLVEQIGLVLEKNKHKFERCILALDAPLEAMLRPNQPARQRAVSKGVHTGAEQRQCEKDLNAFFSNTDKRWNQDLKIQAGSPLAPRISSVVNALVEKYSFAIFGKDRKDSGLQLIEIFPSEAVWALGIMGCYEGRDSKTIRLYKPRRGEEKAMSYDEAKHVAALPLQGFSKLLGNIEVNPIVTEIVNYCCDNSKLNDDVVSKGKGFDDPLESGIAFFTAVSFAADNFHVWGNGDDGTIVGPGKKLCK